MQRTALHMIQGVKLFLLFFLPTFAVAGQSIPENYVTSKPLLLEVRYCECRATETGGGSSELLPSFLRDSAILKVGVSSEDRGFVSSSDLSIGYELKPVDGSPGQFQFVYAGSYTTSDGSIAGKGEALLVKGQWVSLFGSRHDSEAGSQYSNVAVRLAEPGDS